MDTKKDHQVFEGIILTDEVIRQLKTFQSMDRRNEENAGIEMDQDSIRNAINFIGRMWQNLDSDEEIIDAFKLIFELTCVEEHIKSLSVPFDCINQFRIDN